ncbi:MAG: hypothetical protein AVDCRST_MAG15-560, partial [uncultured Rubellimicrobium sp.]
GRHGITCLRRRADRSSAQPIPRRRVVSPSGPGRAEQGALAACVDRGLHSRRGQQDRGDRAACDGPEQLRSAHDARPCRILRSHVPQACPTPDVGTAEL